MISDFSSRSGRINIPQQDNPNLLEKVKVLESSNAILQAQLELQNTEIEVLRQKIRLKDQLLEDKSRQLEIYLSSGSNNQMAPNDLAIAEFQGEIEDFQISKNQVEIKENNQIILEAEKPIESDFQVISENKSKIFEKCKAKDLGKCGVLSYTQIELAIEELGIFLNPEALRDLEAICSDQDLSLASIPYGIIFNNEQEKPKPSDEFKSTKPLKKSKNLGKLIREPIKRKMSPAFSVSKKAKVQIALDTFLKKVPIFSPETPTAKTVVKTIEIDIENPIEIPIEEVIEIPIKIVAEKPIEKPTAYEIIENPKTVSMAKKRKDSDGFIINAKKKGLEVDSQQLHADDYVFIKKTSPLSPIDANCDSPKYKSMSRKEKKNLKGYDCEHCKGFYDAFSDHMSPSALRNQCSEHRHQYSPPKIPEWYHKV